MFSAGTLSFLEMLTLDPQADEGILNRLQLVAMYKVVKGVATGSPSHCLVALCLSDRILVMDIGKLFTFMILIEGESAETPSMKKFTNAKLC